ncbi:MAG: hypothetical protein COU66_00080 [Candidatus Pacebacteria bacterium CG10_big_fil_rev_8_21_14_0_10_44_11]|nr:MAG: hypothetical protein COU66_00080 [Candidatus Pacebacteria bacterium CG10_big_fil_rev_8_21_14_0_10_44_11]
MQDKNSLQTALTRYKRSNYHVQTWEEYVPELNTMSKKVIDYIKKNTITIDAVVPLLRGGNIPATYLAYKLDILRILPVQYKYFFVNKTRCELRKLQGIQKDLIKTKKPNFLLIEGNHCYGNQAKYAAKDLKKDFPDCRIIYGASNIDYRYQDVVEDAEATFYGELTNCCKELTDEECKKLGIQYKKELLFPWETVDEEWEIVELKQHRYNNLDSIMANSPLVAEYPLE